MSSASDSPTDDGETVSVDTSDPTVACLSIVSWSMAIAALGAIVLLAVILLMLGVSQYTFLMVWFIGAPFAAAVAALGALFIQLGQAAQRRRH
ncbi:hypothetical protein FBZ89_101165 [Nitrospirillum amazonense]|uniref:Uncharacterized protein n=1 Tax=Nitrospirillum amazonense TaxID=28077 RepID=A0A560FSF1_9PROT|nr:hypothetical protein [Nitrospirillum amazonense]TWB24539.1 hypothetical protein FBZ89_101165 [Nitrospirillum amazonense]